MRAFELSGPRRGAVIEAAPPVPAADEVLIDVERVGLCGTDVEFFTGEMQYLHTGHARYPLRLGHEWCGRVADVGDAVPTEWLGRRVTGDTMLGDGSCRRCRRGRQHVCAHRTEVGVRGGRPGALAEQLVVPVSSLHRLPDHLDAGLGALVEPGGNAWRAAAATAATPADRVLVMGPGTIGTLVALFVRAAGAEVHLMGASASDLDFVRGLGLAQAWPEDRLPDLAWDAVVDATFAPHLPARALELVEPGGRLVYIGLAGAPSRLDTRDLVLKDVTATGILSASPALGSTITAYAEGLVDPRPLIAATVPLESVADVLAGERPAGAGPGPKIQVDPRLAP